MMIFHINNHSPDWVDNVVPLLLHELDLHASDDDDDDDDGDSDGTLHPQTDTTRLASASAYLSNSPVDLIS